MDSSSVNSAGSRALSLRIGWMHFLKLICSERLPEWGLREELSRHSFSVSISEEFTWNVPLLFWIFTWSRLHRARRVSLRATPALISCLSKYLA
jgi:hypothetical protein